MSADPLSREAALERIKDSGYRAGLWGSPSTVNPFAKAPSMTEERAAWAAGHCIGAAERKAGTA